MEFNDFKLAVSKQFTAMQNLTLFSSNSTKDQLWDTYLGSYPEGSNPIFRERTQHDCNCCKQFIRSVGNIIAIDQGKLVSIWDIDIEDGPYKIVAQALSKLVKEAGINSIFLSQFSTAGTDRNIEHGETEIVWTHFHQVLPRANVVTDGSIGKRKGDSASNKAVLMRSLTEITKESIEIVEDLIDQNTLYRGTEHRSTIRNLKSAMNAFNQAADKELFCWLKSVELGRGGAFRNTVIGTLLVDISKGEDLEVAVGKYTSKVAPENYKQSKSIVTKQMIQNAEKKIVELGLVDALDRRFARTEDITIQNVLFADRSVKKQMGVFDELIKSSTDKRPNMEKIEQISIDDFVANVIPRVDTIELMVESEHRNNFVSLIAPVNSDAGNMLDWDNNYSWSYYGDVADSMKARVKEAGGDVEGDVRFSIMWNTPEARLQSDLDAWCIQPDRQKIYYPNKGSRFPSSGMLDVDIQSPGSKVAVENITFTNSNKMPPGKYTMIVHNYSTGSGSGGFTAEIEINNTISSFAYNKKPTSNQQIEVGVVTKHANGTLTLSPTLTDTQMPIELWGVTTQSFTKVNMVMRSPNFWDDQTKGNSHIFFMLDGCINPDPARGFYNEYLRTDIYEHRKVFQVLSTKMKAQPTDNQLSGVGFSSTQRNSVVCRVRGSFNRTLQINF